MPKAVSVVLAVFTVLFLVLAPPLFFPHISDNLYTVKEEKKEPEYKGIMTLWNVSDDTSAASGYLNSAISKLEKSNVRVYIEKENMSPETYGKRISEGEKPDIICFSETCPEQPSSLSALGSREGILQTVYNAGKSKDMLYAVPFLLSLKILDGETAAEVKACYISVPQTEDVLKLKMCEEFTDILLSEDMQKSLIEENRVPVLADKGIYETENDMTAVYDAVKEGLTFKNVFE